MGLYISFTGHKVYHYINYSVSSGDIRKVDSSNTTSPKLKVQPYLSLLDEKGSHECNTKQVDIRKTQYGLYIWVSNHTKDSYNKWFIKKCNISFIKIYYDATLDQYNPSFVIDFTD